MDLPRLGVFGFLDALSSTDSIDLARALERLGYGALCYLPHIPLYVRTLRRFGFDDADFANGLCDRLVDTLVAWGSETTVRDRIEAQFRAGASHVCVLALDPAGGLVPDRRALAALAPG